MKSAIVLSALIAIVNVSNAAGIGLGFGPCEDIIADHIQYAYQENKITYAAEATAYNTIWRNNGTTALHWGNANGKLMFLTANHTHPGNATKGYKRVGELYYYLQGVPQCYCYVGFADYYYETMKSVYINQTEVAHPANGKLMPNTDIALYEVDQAGAPMESIAGENGAVLDFSIPQPGTEVVSFGYFNSGPLYDPNKFGLMADWRPNDSCQKGVITNFYLKNQIKTNIPLTGGFSGGPLVDANTGYVIGINFDGTGKAYWVGNILMAMQEYYGNNAASYIPAGKYAGSLPFFGSASNPWPWSTSSVYTGTNNRFSDVIGNPGPDVFLTSKASVPRYHRISATFDCRVSIYVKTGPNTWGSTSTNNVFVPASSTETVFYHVAGEYLIIIDGETAQSTGTYTYRPHSQ